MQMLVKLIFIMAAYMHNFAKASDVCEKPPQPENTVPLTDFSQEINRIRFQCVKGYVRKAGTSNLIQCRRAENGKMAWYTGIALKCIPDPKIPISTVTPIVAETQSPQKQTTLCTTEKTSKNHPTLQGTSSPTTETGHIALTTTLEVVTTKTRRTTSQPTLMSTTKEYITTTNETTTSYTSRKYMTTTAKNQTPAALADITPAVSGVTIFIVLLIAALAVLIYCLRKRNHRSQIYQPDVSISYSPVCKSELNSAQLNKTSENSTEGCVIENNSGIPNRMDTCDELVQQTDS